MSQVNYRNLKVRYRLYFLAIVWSALASSAYPTWFISFWFAGVLNIPFGAPVIEHKFGLLWFGGFILTGVVNLVFSYLVISIAISKYKGWSKQQALDYFVHYRNFPQHWLKKPKDVT